MCAVDKEDAADDVAVPGEVLGEAVDHEVRAVSERLEQEWRGERRVDDERSSRVVGCRRHRGDVGEPDEWVGDHIDHDSADVGAGGCRNQLAMIATAVRREIHCRDADAEIAERTRQQRIRAPVAGTDHHHPRTRCAHHQGGRQEQRCLATRGHARDRHRPSRDGLELDHGLLEALRIAATVAAVHVATIHRFVHGRQVRVCTHRREVQRRDQVRAITGVPHPEPGSRRGGRGINGSGHGQAGCARVRKNGAVPA